MPIWKRMSVSISDKETSGQTGRPVGRTEEQRNAIRQRRVGRRERRWWSRAAINVFIVWHLFALFIWLVPNNSAIVQACVGPHSPVNLYMTLTGFAQSWTMFSPTPDHLDVTLEARILYADGETRSWFFPRMARMGYAQRFEEERWRKLVEIVTHNNSTQMLCAAMARYAARVNNIDSQNRPVSVELFEHSRQIPPPGDPIPPITIQPLQTGNGPSITPIRPEDLK